MNYGDAVLEAMTEAVVVVDSEFRIVDVNAYVEVGMQTTRAELAGKLFWDVFVSTSGTIIETELRRAMGERVSVQYDLFYEHAHSWFEANAFPLADGVAIHIRDITKRRRAELILVGQKRALELAMNGAPLATILTEIVHAVEAQAVEKMVASIYLIVDGCLRHGVAPSLPASYIQRLDGLEIGPNAGSCGTSAYTGEPVIVRDVTTDPLWANFRELAAEFDLRACWSTPLRASTGEVIATFAQYHREVWEPTAADRDAIELLGRTAAMVIERERDLRRREVAERELERAKETAERASRAKDEFLAMLGHELRNPLAPIVTALYLMEIRGEDTTRSARRVIARQVEHVTHLLDDLLDVSRFAHGRVTLRKSVVDLAEVIARAIEMTRPIYEQRRHNLSLSLGENLLVEGDPARLAQVFANLLSNAAKYSERGRRTTVAAVRTDHVVTIVVRDSGIGIDPAVLATVFEPFTQAEQAIDRAEGGLGIGLAIVKNLVLLHGGHVEAHSEGIGCGAEFTIELPATDLPLSEPMVELPHTPRAVATERRILIVDDNVDAAEMMAETLAALGHTVRVETDGLAGLAAFTELNPEVVLLDIGLPMMNGYEVARQLREHPGAGKVLIVAVTGYGQVSDRERAQAAGFDAHLVKPIVLDALLELIDQLPAG